MLKETEDATAQADRFVKVLEKEAHTAANARIEAMVGNEHRCYHMLAIF
eukprot:SAG31_NODE_35541_length_322_cov_0.690583_1_plen_48_part_01